MGEKIFNCEEGRRAGCQTFCCRLIVRLRPGERDPTQPDNPQKSCVDKDPKTGLCLAWDRETGLCKVWDKRPGACREFDCRNDVRLDVVLEHGFTNLVQLTTLAARREAQRRRADD